ncbi:DUF3126 family protein [Parvularcula maris]|uniref:DUF3126 family protein n=1 Tax=Parvularcula maris TaxID=2965077 RepID=A0A9X2RI40_9PROT|nr:DUF3126 family protein [Parvularcula maris]MCQ8184546.1 DUF3126 family protein [Parvularcula maris]
MQSQEIERLQVYLRQRFNDESLTVRGRPNKEDSAEVYVGEEFIGVLSRDDEDEDLSYDFHMAILDVDLDTIGNA